MIHRVTQILIALDQLVNSFLPNGWADETLSSRAYRLNRSNHGAGFTMHAVDTLFFWQDEHCKQAYFSERKRKHLPPEFRNDMH